jgi:hypothetical protein
MKTGPRRGAVIAAVASIATIGTLAPASPAIAYSKDYWTGKSSVGTVCASDARAQYTRELTDITYGGGHGVYVDLMYSPTCRSAWARMRNGYGPFSFKEDDNGCYVEIRRKDGRNYFSYYQPLESNKTRQTVMVDDSEANYYLFESTAHGFCHSHPFSYEAFTPYY